MVMRRVLVDTARSQKTLKRGGEALRITLDGDMVGTLPPSLDVLSLHEALKKFEVEFPRKAELVKLSYFAGLSIDEAAELLGVSKTTAYKDWHFSRAWLKRELTRSL